MELSDSLLTLTIYNLAFSRVFFHFQKGKRQVEIDPDRFLDDFSENKSRVLCYEINSVFNRLIWPNGAEKGCS